MKTGIEIIAEERQRQISVEGWTPEHDAQHENGELAIAATCYAYPETALYVGEIRVENWPFEPEYFKPSPRDRVRELAKAGALIAAEIDRLNNISDETTLQP